mmetsp:Transcript_24639/g.56881  ORF Transcript_24639/g.56881 Transcript_24639/m.56881 type:complete len:251 (+) Transcript_24639:79-831(+)
MSRGSLPPAATFCGSFGVALGVHVSAFITYARAIAILGVTSSQVDTDLFGWVIHPVHQLIFATVSLLGVPLAVRASIACLARLWRPLREYLLYVCGTLAFDFIFSCIFVYKADPCLYFVEPRILRGSPLLVCSFFTGMLAFWLSVWLIFSAYLAYVIYSEVEVLQEGLCTNLITYERKAGRGGQDPLLPEVYRRDLDHGGVGPAGFLPSQFIPSETVLQERTSTYNRDVLKASPDNGGGIGPGGVSAAVL